MATKTFKIGLSNTDKQNMAQEVYERLLALTFPEYDSAESYDVGDFVVYNDQLYKCIGATSGAWDSSKWQLATLNDLLTDIEDAVAFVNDKANVDGNYPTMTVGVADQLSPYDDESGDDQDEPFSFQATGTGNGTQPDFATGAIALMKEKQGNTVVVNQLAKELNNTNWVSSNASSTATFTNGVARYVQGSTIYNNYADGIRTTQQINYTTGHKYLYCFQARGTNGTKVGGDITNVSIYSDTELNENTFSLQIAITDGGAGNENFIYICFRNTTTNVENDWFEIKNIYLIDLTQMFNGDIPSDLLSHPENFFRYYQGSLAYNTGELVNANGRYIKCIGRNQWDEETESGYVDPSTGQPASADGYLRSKNFNKCIGGLTYYLYGGNSINTECILWYDKDKNYIGYYSNPNNTTLAPSNACYFKIYFNGSAYNHDITISLYYEGESGYDQYYPYEVLTNNDTGTEVLRSAGSVADIKLPNGEIKRNVGTQDLSQLSWSNISNWRGSGLTLWYATLLTAKPVSTNLITTSGYNPITFNTMYNHAATSNKCIAINSYESTIEVCILDSSLTGNPTGTLYYELKEPTTEQGTPFSENLVIDDFGSMDFSGTNGVPQGNLIFYPVDYKAFIDTLYDYTEGTPSNVALKSDLASDKSELQGVDTQLFANIGGILRHQLVSQVVASGGTLDFNDTKYVDLGTLTWTWNEEDIFYVAITDKENGVDNIICSIYKNAGVSFGAMGQNTITGNNSNNLIYVKTTAYNDATAFKAAMKGVLLAYEKASE